MRLRSAAIATLLLALTACSTPTSEPSGDTRTAGSTTATTPSASGSPGNMQIRELANGLRTPWGLVPLKDGSLLISERDSKQIVHLVGGKATLVATVSDAAPGGEGGSLGLVASSDERTIYAYYTAANDNRIVSMSWDGSKLGAPAPVLSGLPKGGRHDGGRMIVGPDGFLYVGVGETGDTDLAQDKNSLGGKILRITTAGKPAPGNPFGSEVFSYGHRNVEGLAFDPQGQLWASEFGDQTWDELNRIVRGGNYGWPIVEGSSNNSDYRNPAVVWSTADASPSGLAYWRGSLWMAALRGQQLWEIPLVDGKGSDGKTGTPISHYAGAYGRLRTVAVTADGNGLLLTTSNTDGRGDVRTGDDRVLLITAG